MKFSSIATAAFLVGDPLVECFHIQSPLSTVRRSTHYTFRQASSSENNFDSILGEGSSYEAAAKTIQNENSSRRSSSSSSPVIRVPDGSPAATVTLASSVAASDIYGDDLALEDDQLVAAEGLEEEVTYDPLVNNEILKRQHEKKVKREQRKAAGGVMRYVKNPLLLVKGKDFSDVALTVIIPAFVSVLVLKKASELVFGKLNDIADDMYDQACEELGSKAGDLDAIEKVYKQYTRKLFFNGAPSYVNEQLLTKYAQYFADAVTVSPKSMKSFSHLLSLMKMSDVEVAKCIVTACRKNPESMFTVAKLLFAGTHLVKSPEGQKELGLLIQRGADIFGGMELCMTNQRDMAREAYRDAVANKGPGQTKLLPDYEYLGLDKETATKIFLKTKELGYLSREELTEKELSDEREAERKKANARMQAIRDKIAEDGSVIGDLDDIPDYVEEDEKPDTTGTAQECSKCGYILVVAPGREDKFFSASFTCPGCGAGRDDFNTINLDD